MRSSVSVGTPPLKPLMIFDGDCNFCKLWIRRWQQITGDLVDYLPLQDTQIGSRFPEISKDQLRKAVHFIDRQGSVSSGAEAVFQAMAENPHYEWPLGLYEHSNIFARVTERAYRFVAEHRAASSWVTRIAWGKHVERPDYHLVSWVFLRCLGAIYLLAFLSLSLQIEGLIGTNGILPAKELMGFVGKEATLVKAGLERYHHFPTLCWFSSEDKFLRLQCTTGVALSVALIVGLAPAPVLFLLWLIYLSLTTVGRDFLSFQWDNLLLEMGFLSIFLAPLRIRPRLWTAEQPSRIVVWLLRWLVFRLMLESGCVKLLSGDPHWRDLTALTFHYETQPLPTWVGWYAHQLPLAAHKFCTVVLYAIEIALPLFIFAPRRLRHCACAMFVFLQICILLTGNYCFFNLLTIALCLMLLDDFALVNTIRRVWPSAALFPDAAGPKIRWRFPRQVTVPLASIAIVVSLVQLSRTFRIALPWPQPIRLLHNWVAPFRTFNPYGLFAVMTTSRNEIEFEGSEDGVNWKQYEFKYKPGEVHRRPGFIVPHQPRLDWQMWFAALGSYQQNPWLVSFALHLLHNSPEVLRLLKSNPFPNSPPRFVRAVTYEYHFTDLQTRRLTGAWWRREAKGNYLPAIELSEKHK